MSQRTITITCLVAVLSMGIFIAGAGAQDKATKKQQTGCCPGCWMNPNAAKGNATGESQAMIQQCMSMMQNAGVKPEMMQRCQMMMRTPIFMDSPCAIYGQADTIQLSEEQKEKLIAIENEARKEALAVLTDEQKKKMGDIPDKPLAMAQMCQQMCSKMITDDDEGKTSPMMMCPMMHMMGGKDQKGSMMCPWMQTPPDGNDVQAKSSEQMTCPVMGGPIKKDIFTEYKGKNVYFCCPECKGKFEAEPEKYLDKLPQFEQ